MGAGNTANSESSTGEGQTAIARNEHKRELSQAGEQGRREESCLPPERQSFDRSVTREGSPAAVPVSPTKPLCPKCRHGVAYEIPSGYYCETKRNFGVEYNCKEFEEVE
jgi:hypothetical protein